jgi:ribokinase
MTTRGGAWHIPPWRVDAVDATAAGDAWVGALVAALSRGDDLLAAATFASVAGALAVTRPGAQPSLPSAADVLVLLPAAPAPRRLA